MIQIAHLERAIVGEPQFVETLTLTDTSAETTSALSKNELYMFISDRKWHVMFGGTDAVITKNRLPSEIPIWFSPSDDHKVAVIKADGEDNGTVSIMKMVVG